MKLKTGIEKLDEILDGGIDSGSTVLILSGIFVNKSLFAQQIISYRMTDGDKAIYITTTKTPAQILKTMYYHGFEVSDLEFIDAVSFTLNKQSDAKYLLKEKLTNIDAAFSQLNDLFNKAMEEIQGFKVVVLDALESFMGLGIDKIITVLNAWKEKINSSNSTLLILFTNWGYNVNDIEKLKKFADKVIYLDSLEKKLFFANYFTVEGKPRILYSETLTGISIYVPKILITGPYHAGKSTVIRNLSERAVSVNRLGTTIALDHGYIEKRGLVCDIFGTPGQERFDWILSILARDVFGVILIVDSTKPESFPRALEMLQKAREEGVPYVVFANKQDLENALSIEEIAKRLGVPKEDVIPTVATTGEGLEEGLKKLIDKIFKYFHI